MYLRVSNYFCVACCSCLMLADTAADDYIADLQAAAISEGATEFAHWGTKPDRYTHWRTHSNRLIPVYTFGTANAAGAANLDHYIDSNSAYRTEDGVRRLYGRVPENTVNPAATWMDQTNIADIQRAAVAAGKRHIFLVVFDGMDWNTTQAAAIYNEQSITYRSGRGTGTFFQSYDARGTSQFGFMVTSPHNNGTNVDVDTQTVENPGGKVSGGYDASVAGSTPWEPPSDPGYMIAMPADGNPKHAYTDSASSATSMTAGIKTYNASINVEPGGEKTVTIAHELQDDGWAVGAVSSVPISHATPAAAYAHNVSRNDYQDISRDLLGLPSISHPDQPLKGLDVLIGGGFGRTGDKGPKQGANYESGNVYLADSDLKAASLENQGHYVTAVRTAGKAGSEMLQVAAGKAAKGGHNLLGFFGVGPYNAHLPFQTANGDYAPVPGNRKRAEEYSAEDVNENPNLADCTRAALQVLQSRNSNFWLMVEAGDVDWASHDNNLDNSIGAVNSGDAAVRVLTDWVEQHSSWDDALLIVTADHGHMLTILQPEQLIRPSDSKSE